MHKGLQSFNIKKYVRIEYAKEITLGQVGNLLYFWPFTDAVSGNKMHFAIGIVANIRTSIFFENDI